MEIKLLEFHPVFDPETITVKAKLENSVLSLLDYQFSLESRGRYIVGHDDARCARFFLDRSSSEAEIIVLTKNGAFKAYKALVPENFWENDEDHCGIQSARGEGRV